MKSQKRGTLYRVMNMQTRYPEKYIKFGLKIQYYRKLRGMTQEAFADKVGISWSYSRSSSKSSKGGF